MANAGIGRGNGNKPLDMRLVDNLDVDEEPPQLEFVVDDDFEELPPAERKHKKMPQHELEDKIKRFKTHLVSLHLPDKGNSLRKSLFEFEQELRIRNIEKKRHEVSQKKAKADEKQAVVKVAPSKAPETKLASKHHGSNGVVEEPERRVIRTRAITLKKMVETLSSKTDENANRGCTSSGSPYSEEIDFPHSARGKGPPVQRPSIAEDSSYDRVKNKTRANSGEQAGPSSRQERSGQLKPCNGCDRMVSPTNLHSIGTGVDCEVYCPSCSQKLFPLNGSLLHSSKHGQLSNSSESSDDDSLKQSNGAKRRRHSPNTEEPAGPVVEIFSSDEEDNDTGDMSAVFQPLHIDQQKGCALRSTNGRRMEDVKLAYPSKEDPEAVEVEYQDLGRLAPLEFLNDTIIDFYIKYMQRPEFLSSEQKKRFHFFNSFFYKKLSETANTQQHSKKQGADLSKLRKWTKGTNVFEKDYLFVPIHDKFHWSLAIICHPGVKNDDSDSVRCILHLDSMNPGHKSAGVFRLLKMYMVTEWAHQAEEDGNGGPRQGISMEFTTKKVLVPQQDNESDCGLFLLHYIQCFLQEAPARFTRNDLESSNRFGRNWFKPSKASQLRQEILDILERLFEERGAQDSRNKEPIEVMPDNLEPK
ncbi:ubiquitin-like-specific protease 1C/D [Marchantia polymorpha subsp. ruderalis]|uniref:Ubiquitin-like protease family profile domain-containing protein n=1 Tax=Marchantia polymorpha TaxID=3197 RepID=A0A2R6XB60_MARPO|nr:hypothetical protein MARPO_0025s0054 [Marchantia polymorpha]BBN03775.1 hypothetical protein Mp_2g26300 [Marchantia polymorpha subsp. ruderalis]|eukprot:PTQ43360.1 hypothetical protein MARPO_0025s0054 [Marchantia polymorpha]